MKGFFITGTDTEIGKTCISAGLTHLAAQAGLRAAAIKPGRYNVWGCVVAITFLAVINGGLNIAGASVYIADFVNGTALISGVALAVYLRRRRGA